MATPQMTLRVDLVTRERWEAAARGRGVPLARFIRECVERELGAAGSSAAVVDTDAEPSGVRVPETVGERQGGQPAAPSSFRPDFKKGMGK